ncbi:hypothetical protein CVT26_010634, partial [Gymnopilus dilepis]
MGKGGRKPTNLIPDCKLFACLPLILSVDYCLVVKLSSDGKKVLCETCFAARPSKETWMNKQSLTAHLKSPLHTDSVNVQAIKASNQQAREQLQRERKVEEMEFVKLSAGAPPLPPQASTAPAHKPSEEEQEIWDSLLCSDASFDIGSDPNLAAAEERRRLEEEAVNFGLWYPEGQGEPEGDLLPDDEDDILAELLENACPDLDDILHEEDHKQPNTSAPWSPYESKTMFLLDTLDNLPRMRISNSLMRVILWVLKECGARDVPSLHRFRGVQASLRTSGVPTIHRKSPKGNLYSMNDPRALVAMDWANPLVCNEIHPYPVIPVDGIISEVYHAAKWRTVDRHTLSPMYNAGNNRHYYIDEVALLKGGDFIIPLRWLEYSDGNIVAEAYSITFNEEGHAAVEDFEMILVKASDLQYNFLDLMDQARVPIWQEDTINKGYPGLMPNPDRALAQGDPLYSSWIDVFGDDVSGNRSKSWNKHWNIYISHRGLPRKLLYQEFHVHFVSTSPVATVSEQFHGIKEIIESTHKEPVKVQHGTSGEQMRFKIYVNCGPGDNPAQSEVCGHIGGKGNHPCRKCLVGGTQQSKESDAGYHNLFHSGTSRTAEEIFQDVQRQVKLACLGIAKDVQEEQTRKGIKDAYTQFWIEELIQRARKLRKETPSRSTQDIQTELFDWVSEHTSDIYNPFLSLKGFDPALDTPVEILHTILLGVVKYLWHSTHTNWTAHQKNIYALRLQSTDQSGLSIHAIRANYIMQYANSLIGRQFKTLAQVNVFHVHDLVDNTTFLLTKA